MLRKTIGVALSIALLAGGVVVAREVTRPATITFEEYGIKLDTGETRAINVRTSGGLPFGEGIRWRIDPSWLGTISERGEFHAGPLSGSGSVTARFGSGLAVSPVTIACPKEARIQGIRFDVSCGRSADVYVDVSTYGGAALAAKAVDRNVEKVAFDLGITSERRFRVYYFGTRQGFIAGVSELGREFSSPTEFEADAVYIDAVDVIAIDQSADLLKDTEGPLRHELVHRMLRHYVGYGNIDEVPMWLNEGWAFVEASGYAGRLYIEARLVSASMAHVGKMPSLRSLTTLGEWNARTGVEGLYQYYAAAQATELLMLDAGGRPGLHRILTRVRAGDSWAEALKRGAPGFDFDDFQDRFSARVAAHVPTFPAMQAMAGTPYGPGTTVIAYGLGPGAFATLDAKGPIDRKQSGKVDPYGVFVTYMGGDFPAGDYVMTFESEGKQLTTNAKH